MQAWHRLRLRKKRKDSEKALNRKKLVENGTIMADQEAMDLEEFATHYRLVQQGEKKPFELMKELGMTKPTFYRYKNQTRERVLRMASVKRVEYKSGRVVYRIVICQGYDKKGNKLVKNLTYSVNQSATPKQQEREAKKYAMDMEDKLKYGYDYNAEKMSFEDFAYKWLESVKDNIAYGTYAGYKQVLESRIIPYFKGDKIAHIKTPHIEAFYRTLVDDYSAGTIKRFANVLNLIFKTAKRYSMIENNPCQDAQKPKRKDEDEGLKFFTPKQALMFMKSLDMSYEVTYKGHQRIDDTGKPYYVNEYTESYTVPTQYKVFFTLSLFCGFRKGETLALHWNDIDFKEKKISISKSVGMTENGFDYKEPKTKKSVRKVSIPDDVIPLLKQYHFEYIQTRFSHGTAWQGDLSNGGNLFIQADGKAYGAYNTLSVFHKAFTPL